MIIQPRKMWRKNALKEFPWAQYTKDGILVNEPVWITERETNFNAIIRPFIGKEVWLFCMRLFVRWVILSEYEKEVFSISELLSMTNLGNAGSFTMKTRLKGLKRGRMSQLLHVPQT